MIFNNNPNTNKQKFIDQYMAQVKAGQEKRGHINTAVEAQLMNQSPLIISKVPKTAIGGRRKVYRQKSTKIAQSPYSESYVNNSINRTHLIPIPQIQIKEKFDEPLTDDNEIFGNTAKPKKFTDASYILAPHAPPTQNIKAQYTGLSNGKTNVKAKKLSSNILYMPKPYSEDNELDIDNAISFTEAINITSYRNFPGNSIQPRTAYARESKTRCNRTKNRLKFENSLNTTKNVNKTSILPLNTSNKKADRNSEQKRPCTSMTKYKRHSVFSKVNKGSVKLNTILTDKNKDHSLWT